MTYISQMEEINYICNLMYDTFEIPVHFLDFNGNLLYKAPFNYKCDPSFFKEISSINQFCDDENTLSIFKTTSYLENYYFIRLNEVVKGIIVVGPSTYVRLNFDMISGLINDFASIKDKSSFFASYQSIPVINKSKLVYSSVLLYYLIFKKPINADIILKKNKDIDSPLFKIDNAKLTLSKNRQESSLHHNPSYERKLLHAVKVGRKDLAIVYLNHYLEGELGVLCKKSYIRNRKNLTIAVITLVTRSAIEGGLHPEIAYTLNDIFIQKLEDLKELNKIDNLMEKAVYTLTDRVSEVSEQKYSKPIAACQYYIFNHLYDEITLSDLAILVDMNPSYLSVLFKREVGVSLSEFIQQSKVSEAKNLLTLTNNSITEIFTSLQFTDQSYFTKIFKKFTGFTPRQYRNLHFIS